MLNTVQLFIKYFRILYFCIVDTCTNSFGLGFLYPQNTFTVLASMPSRSCDVEDIDLFEGK